MLADPGEGRRTGPGRSGPPGPQLVWSPRSLPSLPESPLRPVPIRDHCRASAEAATASRRPRRAGGGKGWCAGRPARARSSSTSRVCGPATRWRRPRPSGPSCSVPASAACPPTRTWRRPRPARRARGRGRSRSGWTASRAERGTWSAARRCTRASASGWAGASWCGRAPRRGRTPRGGATRCSSSRRARRWAPGCRSCWISCRRRRRCRAPSPWTRPRRCRSRCSCT